MIVIDPVKKREIYLKSLKPLTRRQFKLVLLEFGILEKVNEMIEAIEDPTFKAKIKIEYEDSATFERLSPTIEQLHQLMGIKESEVDVMWEAGLKL